ncbi:MAG: hypothetical protein ACJ71Q_05435 [Terriglobales bacterium]
MSEAGASGAVTAAPAIQANAVPATIQAGQSSTLTWSAVGADSVSIDYFGKVATNGVETVNPAKTTTYTLRALGSGGAASATVTVTVTAAPAPTTASTTVPTIALSVNPNTISAGQSAKLVWSTTNASSVTIDNGVGNVQPPASGGITISPSKTTTYTATAIGTGGQTASQSVTLTATAEPTPTSSGDVNVITWHMDNARSGLNNQETLLTPAKVKSGNFGKLFSYVVDGYLYAQPLYVSGLTLRGGKHNVVFAATEFDSVYAFDADNYGDGSPLWKTSLLQPGETPQPGGNPKPSIGITSTPVIDLNTQTMYVVSAQQGTAEPFFRLHALDITTGAERSGSPVVISATVKGTNGDSVNGVLKLTTSCLQRTALLLSRGTIYFGFSACHSGWMLAYNATDLRQTGVLNMSPNTDGYGTYGGAGGVWMGGGGPVGDDKGFAYVTTGNGPYDGSSAWGESILKLDSQLNIVDHFTPYDWAFLQCKDLDLSGGGAMLIPSTGQLLAGGKGGKMYLVNSSSLGGTQPNDTSAAQTLWFDGDHYPAQCTNTNTGEVYSTEITGYQIFSTAAFFNGSVYLGITAGPVQQFSYQSGHLAPGPMTDAQIGDGAYGTTPFVSSNGNQGAVMWMLDHGSPIQDPVNATPTQAILRAYDAANVSVKLYDSSANSADQAGFGIKFTSPIVANGKVFIGTAHDTLSAANPRGELDVYGLRQ